MITVTLTARDLTQREACAPAMALFATMTEGRNTITVEWTPLHVLWLAAVYPEYSGWLVEHGLVPAISLHGANLTDANLHGANLRGANLRGAIITTAQAIPGWTATPMSCGCCASLTVAS